MNLEDMITGGGMTIGSLMDLIAKNYPDKEAIVFYEPDKSMDEPERITYQEYQQKVNQLAKGLMAIGVGKGDHIAIWMPNNTEFLYILMAAGKIGAVLVGLNTMLKSYEIEYMLRQSDSKSRIVFADVFAGSDLMLMINEMIPELKQSEFGKLSCKNFPMLKNVITLSRTDRSKKVAGTISFDELMHKGNDTSDEDLATRQNSVTETDAAMLLYTSGTTGTPKGALLSQRGNIINSYHFGRNMGLDFGESQLNPIPLFHVGGSHLGAYCSLTLALTLIIIDRFIPENVLKIMQKERPVAYIGSPTVWHVLMSHHDFEKYDIGSLRTGAIGAAPVPIQMMKDIITKMHASDVTIIFGQTEASGCITQTRLGDSIEIRCETIGKSMPNSEAVIKDPASGKIVPPGVQGEICTKAFHNMIGYYKLPEETARTFDSEGWMHTGDLGTMDEAGNIRFRGRLKDMIIVGGENCYAAEVERFLEQHPKVSSACVIGVPDKKYGEVVMAYLETSDHISYDEIYNYCKGKIASFKIPKYIAVNKEKPLTAAGKVQKFKLQEIAAKELGLTK